ncbi:hypothetical protein [Pseudoalteromonas rubra]|uniref:hypothetical protein n=1 Tax=Pseudoalteromonas rubra TaxID=43658 RepID=UPI002DBEF3B9|nr:hypothetical protein [Pseudoalteromonas rubra]MEC4088270.1 hypothetical protein [Pseudoalteromonas rubra]
MKFFTDFNGLSLFNFAEFKDAINAGNTNKLQSLLKKQKISTERLEVKLIVGEPVIVPVPLEDIYGITIGEEELIVSLMLFTKFKGQNISAMSNEIVISKLGCFDS